MKGLGIDLCGIERIQNTLEKSPGFLNRYYTAEERRYIEEKGQAGASSAAAMFAAKEAFLKALGTGIGRGLSLQDISVAHEASGAPVYVLSEKAKEKLQERGASAAFLSLSHESGVAAAVCVIE